ncbi:fez family zinc finger protein erm-like [Sebastes umbrosus]|uniref:fez family zinc finger protein erm-like n=1 Tax=Sebastes umbrosus TaxID=72105 RepID=UPI00189DA34D|nr:fez family zinc finger protein erm-like [Sebastes umbrosus]
MSACCVSGCKNRQSSTRKLKFYRIPFQANRRRLWLTAIQRETGSTEPLRGTARVCGAHFKSKEASTDSDSPDFVPSVFTCTKQSSKKKGKWFYGRRKKQRRTANVETEEKTTPPRVDSPVDLQSSSPVLMEEKMQTRSTPSMTKEGETLTEEAETETETATIKSQTTSSPNKVSPSFKVPAGFTELHKRTPILLLKRIYVPGGGYQCEHCNQSFTNVSQLLKHKRLHEEESCSICEMCGKIFTSQEDFTEHQCVHEPSFPCNMCDRSFTTSHNLKRHKLLHVKDGRKCHTCGVLFCQRHNHVLFLPLAETVTEYEEEDSTTVERQLYNNVMPENHQPEKPEPSQAADLDDDAPSNMAVSPLPPKPGPLSDLDDDAPSNMAVSPLPPKPGPLSDLDDDAPSNMAVSPLPPKPGPLSKTHKSPSPVSYTRISSEFPEPVYLKPPPLSHIPPPVDRILSDLPPDYPVQPLPPQHLELPPSLKLFSPLYLTSAFLEVKRNYEYILSKPIKAEKKIVKEEQCELPLIPPDERSVELVKKEGTAYDLEIKL